MQLLGRFVETVSPMNKSRLSQLRTPESYGSIINKQLAARVGCRLTLNTIEKHEILTLLIPMFIQLHRLCAKNPAPGCRNENVSAFASLSCDNTVERNSIGISRSLLPSVVWMERPLPFALLWEPEIGFGGGRGRGFREEDVMKQLLQCKILIF